MLAHTNTHATDRGLIPSCVSIKKGCLEASSLTSKDSILLRYTLLKTGTPSSVILHVDAFNVGDLLRSIRHRIPSETTEMNFQT